MKIVRDLQTKIVEALDSSKVAIIYGARQVGKTTLSLQVANELCKEQDEFLYLNADEPDTDSSLTGKTSTELKSLIGNHKLLIIDEAQRVTNIGITLKIIHDTFPNVKIIATGSSSFDLANKIVEPLTGRSRKFRLFPFSLNEIKNYMSEREAERLLSQLLINGAYPEVFTQSSSKASEVLDDITMNYLYKDLLAFGGIKDSDLVRNLLQALAFQVGNEVSYTELANLLEIDKNTVKKYIELLEKAYIIYRLRPLARNRRKEVGKFRKIYFYDLGVRNKLIGNLSDLDYREDKGALWENFCINERMKFYQVNSLYPNTYFWRNYYGAEVDFVEEEEGEVRGFEFKWQKEKFTKPKAFLDAYDKSTVKIINQRKVFDLWKEYGDIG